MKQIFLFALAGTLVLAGCSKNDAKTCAPPATTTEDQAIAEDKAMTEGEMDSDNDFSRRYQCDKKFNFKTVLELLAAREATKKYRNIENAFRDHYADINVIMQNMGYHYMRSEIVDDKFNPSRPEILVYNKRKNGKFELVAVEYAIPLDKSVNAPKGFSGTADVWDHNDGFGLWLLHAWVWQFNPDGVFHSTNPNVIVKELPLDMPMKM
jgi:hypothetical protein